MGKRIMTKWFMAIAVICLMMCEMSDNTAFADVVTITPEDNGSGDVGAVNKDAIWRYCTEAGYIEIYRDRYCKDLIFRGDYNEGVYWKNGYLFPNRQELARIVLQIYGAGGYDISETWFYRTHVGIKFFYNFTNGETLSWDGMDSLAGTIGKNGRRMIYGPFDSVEEACSSPNRYSGWTVSRHPAAWDVSGSGTVYVRKTLKEAEEQGIITPTPTVTTKPAPTAAAKPTSTAPTGTKPTSGAAPGTEGTPTHKPGVSPSASPTHKPGASTTKSPSASPTQKPGASTTKSPSASPTQKPGASTTKSPSVSPTQKPGASPTTGPTAKPSGKPSSTPTPVYWNPEFTPTPKFTLTPTPTPTPVSCDVELLYCLPDSEDKLLLKGVPEGGRTVIRVQKGANYGPRLDLIPKCKGYEWKGWFSLSEGKGDKITGNTVNRKGINHTLYGCWERNPTDEQVYGEDNGRKIIINFDYCAKWKTDAVNLQGDTVKSTIIMENQHGITLPRPSREGYEFLGWSSKSIFDARYKAYNGDYENMISKTDFNEAEITLYAVWEPIFFMIIFDYNYDYTIKTPITGVWE